MAKELSKVLMMGGGTGGHVFPGLALAQYFKTQGIEIIWLGTKRGLENQLIPQAGFPLHYIEIQGMKGKGIKAWLTFPFKMLYATLQAIKIMQQIKPDVVIGFGGFVSGPGGVASWLLRYPLIIHEQNAKPGFTNKILKYVSKRILTGFPQVFNAKNMEVIGNPIRADFIPFLAPKKRFKKNQPRHLLILGGSLGANILNDIVPQALAQLPIALQPFIWHQAGEKFYAGTQALYEELNLKANVQAFIQDMAQAYLWADLIICRAGALTIAEICAVGLAAILIPYPYASDNHQMENAQFLVKHQAAICVPQSELSIERLKQLIIEMDDDEKRLNLAQHAYQLRKVDVVEKIYHICQEVCT